MSNKRARGKPAGKAATQSPEPKASGAPPTLPAAQPLETVGQGRVQFLAAKLRQARTHHLEGQWNAVQFAADLDDCRSVLLRQRKRGLNSFRTFDKEPHRLGFQES